MADKVKPGMSPKEIATLFYDLLMANDETEWLKTMKIYHQNQAGRYGSSPNLYWKTGRKYVDELGYQYKFKNKVDDQSSEKHIKYFFHRLNREGGKQGSGQVPIHVIIDEDGEWRVDVASF